MNRIINVIDAIDLLSERLGRLIAFLTFGMVLLTTYIVFERYVLGTSTSALTELNWHFMTIVFLFGAGYTLKNNQHVRVDIVYEKLSLRGRAWVNLLGTTFFLIPFCALLIWVFVFSPDLGSSFVGRALTTREGSPNPGGLNTFYLLKLAIPVGLALLLLQGIAEVIKNIRILRSKAES